MMQPELSFPTQSPINVLKIKGQNRKLYDYMEKGNTVTMFDCPELGIGYLNSRISDLRNRAKIEIYSRFISRHGVTCCEYSLKPFEA